MRLRIIWNMLMLLSWLSGGEFEVYKRADMDDFKTYLIETYYLGRLIPDPPSKRLQTFLRRMGIDPVEPHAKR